MDFIFILLILIPICILVGFAASTIGYTAWSLIVPLLFVLFGFDIRIVLFISLSIDCINAFLMTRFSIHLNEIDLQISKKTSYLASASTVFGVFIGLLILLNNQGFFRGGAGYVNIALGTLFIIKGIRMLKNPEKSVDEKGMISDSKKADLVFFAGSIASAFLTGLIGIGGGMNYVLLLMICRGFHIKKAEGTAMYITTWTTATAALVFFGNSFIAGLFSSDIIILIALCILVSGIATYFGAKVAQKLSEAKITILVGSIVLLAATIATIQNIILNS
jgi:uncharacterized membrane protein YfcA